MCWHSLSAKDQSLRLLHGRMLDLDRAEVMGITDIVDRMLAFVQQLRRLEVDHYEFVALKVMLLMTPG